MLSGLGGDPSYYYSAPKGGMLWVFAVDGKLTDTNASNAIPIPSALPDLPAAATPK